MISCEYCETFKNTYFEGEVQTAASKMTDSEQLFCLRYFTRIFGTNKNQYKQENAMRYNNRDDLLKLSFTLKISIFSEVYI